MITLVDKNDPILYKEAMPVPDDMKKHLLIFSFSDVVHTEYAIALDGNYAGKVVYYTYESKHNIKVTNMNFIEWMIGFYKHALECKPGYFTSIENI